MFQDTDDNPYRPPTPYDDEELHEITTPLEPDGVWRWRQTMIIRRSEPVFPQACVLSNDSDDLGTYLFAAISPLGLCLLFVVFQIPAIGLLLAVVICPILKTLGRAWDCRLPVGRRAIVFLYLSEGVIVILFVVGNILSAYGLYHANYPRALLGLMLSLVAFALFWAADRLFLRTHIISSEYVAIEGIHAEYLDRLPEFPDPSDEKIFTLQ